jgi:hypothetical protein
VSPASWIEYALTGTTLEGIGESDCEEIGERWLVQPVNALSSFSYVAVGLVVLAVAVRRGRATLDAWVFALLLAAVGLGSVAFHGPQPDGARVMHDLPILLVVLYTVACEIELVRGSPPSRWVLFVPTALAATGLMIVSVDAGAVLTGLGVAALGVLEVIVYRRRLRDLDDRRRRRSAVLVIALAAVAAATWLLGRTDSPACAPDDVFQFHGLWHLLSAGVFGLWWWLATNGSRHDPQQPPTAVDSESSVWKA